MRRESRWERVGRELKFCDPVRYVGVMRAAEKIVAIYRETTFGGVLPPCVPVRNDNAATS